MTKDEFYNGVVNTRRLDNQNHTFVTVYDPTDTEVQLGNMRPDAIVDWGRYATKQQASNLASELLSRWPWDHPTIIKRPNGTLVHSVIANILLDAKKDVKYISSRWYKPPVDDLRVKGIAFLGDRKRIIGSGECFNWAGVNSQSKDTAIEMILRLSGPSQREDRLYSDSGANKFWTGAYSAWSIYVFEMLTDGSLKKAKLDFMTELYRIYETTDIERMKILNYWDLPSE